MTRRGCDEGDVSLMRCNYRAITTGEAFAACSGAALIPGQLLLLTTP